MWQETPRTYHNEEDLILNTASCNPHSYCVITYQNTFARTCSRRNKHYFWEETLKKNTSVTRRIT